MTEQGTVKKIENGNIVVEIPRKQSCGQCGMCAMKDGEKVVLLTLPNTLNATVGDEVQVAMNSGYVLTSAVIVYIIPLVLASIGLIVGFRLLGEIQSILIALSMLVIGHIIVALLDKKLRRKSGYTPTLVSILNKAKDNHTEGEINE